MGIILFDDQFRNNLLPLSYTRPISEFRVGILTIADKWKRYLNAEISYLTEDYLQEKYPLLIDAENLLINSAICPDEELLGAIVGIKEGEALFADQLLLAVKLNEAAVKGFNINSLSSYRRVEYVNPIVRIAFPENIFSLNDTEIRKDFELLTKGRTSASLSNTNIILGDQVFVEEGVDAECSTFNSRSGPIYLGKGSIVMEGCHIRGSFALCEGAILKMGAKIYGMTTIGPHSKAGGEINNSVIFANSAKGHEGYLGNSVLGEWCNIGADSNNSNMKNNYAEVRLWDYSNESFRRTGLQFCGLVMADHAKCAINTMFNTGTVVGVSANLFGSGFPRNFVPDFSWGGNQGFEVYSLKKMFETAIKVFARRNTEFNEVEQKILTHVFELTEKYRRF
ncbi:UDP-N-acetylglucosamine diphosphorylase/glucosamine-1-phosphate N-acetyltransferase [Daejeonella rubra]|uniref:UDP-N-acetylglucosamine diphosphorylase/glucosamine-1-phosphate N-acetyltransferase n=1 Tax=Daejeonella rubra TaxID=990371 RepID=A0A1G9LXD6_9SPHI|nr:GlmU family protein [Daejeonella rubra]SDL66391.1 UDP-N-acetylglucosamine diphosphorylase/glucosamine-1-phosphate N-acetyltransferase [Daejeonella rubra]